jgi:hypothetical protein
MRSGKKLGRVVLIVVALITGALLAGAGPAVGEGDLSDGQTVYVAAHSSVLIGDRGHPFDLAVTLFVRNTNTAYPLTVESVDYYDTDGKLLKHHLDKPRQLGPLAVLSVFVKPTDVSGGLAPAFIVGWKSAIKVSPPVVEAIMIGDRSGLGISFTTQGRVIHDQSGRPPESR